MRVSRHAADCQAVLLLTLARLQVWPRNAWLLLCSIHGAVCAQRAALFSTSPSEFGSYRAPRALPAVERSTRHSGYVCSSVVASRSNAWCSWQLRSARDAVLKHQSNMVLAAVSAHVK
jgi:hypothetical protein